MCIQSWGAVVVVVVSVFVFRIPAISKLTAEPQQQPFSGNSKSLTPDQSWVVATKAKLPNSQHLPIQTWFKFSTWPNTIIISIISSVSIISFSISISISFLTPNTCWFKPDLYSQPSIIILKQARKLEATLEVCNPKVWPSDWLAHRSKV